MNNLLKLSLITTLVLVGLQEYSHAVTENNLLVPDKFLLAQTRTNINQIEIAVALPDLADIFLKSGQSVSGRVIGINNGQGQILIQRGRNPKQVYIKDIEKVIFRNSAIAYRSNGNDIIRGERDRPVGRPERWNGLPLNSFNLKKPAQGQAVVVLKPPVVSPGRLQGIRSVAKNRTYVVDELRFNLPNNSLSIVATPY